MSDAAELLEKLAADVKGDLDGIVKELETGLTEDERATWAKERAAWDREEWLHDTDFSRGLVRPLRIGRSPDPAQVAYDHAVANVKRTSDTLRRLLDFKTRARDTSRTTPSTPTIAPSAPPSPSGSGSSTQSHVAQDQRGPRSQRWSLLALVAAALLVLTWLAPLTWGATLGFAALFLVLAVVTAVVYWPNVGAAPAIVTILCAIALFGVVYACIQLASGDNPLDVPPDPQLGEAFLIATSMGIAGGLLGGTLDVGPKVVAQIQLLLLLTVLATALAEAFRSLRRPEPSGTAPGSGNPDARAQSANGEREAG